MSDNPEKLCRNPKCTRKNPVKGDWCTAGKCKTLRAQVEKEKKRKLELAAAMLAGSSSKYGSERPGVVPLIVSKRSPDAFQHGPQRD